MDRVRGLGVETESGTRGVVTSEESSRKDGCRRMLFSTGRRRLVGHGNERSFEEVVGKHSRTPSFIFNPFLQPGFFINRFFFRFFENLFSEIITQMVLRRGTSS